MKIIKDYSSKNYNTRPGCGIDMLIIHSTNLSLEKTLKIMSPKSLDKVSSHYLIGRSGEIFQLVEDHHKAWHAGFSHWHNRDDINNYSIGIEMVDTDDLNIRHKNYTEEQMDSLIWLADYLIKKYNIPNKYVLGHSDIAPTRKSDPGEFFDWKILFENNIGVYHKVNYFDYDHSPIAAYCTQSEQVRLFQNKMKKFGYNIETNGFFGEKTRNAVTAFKRHFNPYIIDYTISQIDFAIIDGLLAMVEY